MAAPSQDNALQPDRGQIGQARLAGLLFLGAFLLAFYTTLLALAQTKPVAQTLARTDFFAALAEEWKAPPQYTALAKVRHVVEGPVIAGTEVLPEFGQMVKVMESPEMMEAAAARQFATGQPGREGGLMSIRRSQQEIQRGLVVLPEARDRTLALSFSHPDPQRAADWANLIAEEFLAHTEWLYTDPQLRKVHDLNARLGQARQEIAAAEDSVRAAGSSAQGTQYRQALEDAEIRYSELLGEIATLGNVVYDEPKLVIVERATPPAQPTPPPVLRALYLSLAAGLLAGLGVALLATVALRLRQRRAIATP